MEQILKGIRVVELGQVLAAPFAGAIFADLGAEVVKVERPDGGDDARHMGENFLHGDALCFHIFNRGKKSVALDLKSIEGIEAFNTLLGDADIFIHNMRPGVMKGFGLDAVSTCERFPRLIYCEVSAFGNKGPMTMLPGYEPLLQAFSGLSSINGGPEDSPTRTGASICDQGSGMWTVIGALAMLQRRQKSGKGGVLSTSLLETAMSWAAQKSDAFVNEGRLPERHRSGHPGFVPYEEFETADAPLLICCGNDRLFGKFANELGRSDWVGDPRYSTNRSRLRNKTPLLSEIASLLRERPRAEWIDRLTKVGVPCAQVNTVAQALAHPQVESLGMMLPIPGEDFKLTGLPLTVDGQRPALLSAAPTLGQHNADYVSAPAANGRKPRGRRLVQSSQP
ncbi:CoA transferase [Variovorax sp. J22R133]|uniref:CaiB/BaiF CoA transferase family protein n=1 Tax=Variovorax brevis TaxID=3053503 RepID=UPI0025779903|nr:CoA transferase [Variovorax sp. J22R133]MDM0116244.1 CoA transferase [Variovorax sp. J22R133]